MASEFTGRVPEMWLVRTMEERERERERVRERAYKVI